MLYESETFWLNQKKIAELFGVDLRTISEHLQNIYASGELTEQATLRKIRRVQREGNREVSREIEFYNLDAIISVGYRVNSAQATQFRIWATQTLREFVIKGFVLDDERLKLNKRFGKDYSTSFWNASARYGPASGGSISRSPTSTSSAASTTTRTRRSARRSSRPSRTNCTGP